MDALRAQVSLAAVNWTDSLQAQQTWIYAVHIVELRAALAAVFTARGMSGPAYTDATLTAQATIVRAAHITEIRNAILVVAGVCPPDGCNEVTEYYHVDAVGSVRAVTDQTGAVILRRDYYPFGEGVNSDGGSSLGFTGEESDPESGLNYFGARYYGSWTGRFTTVNPGHVGANALEPHTWNAYAYVHNNPISLTDPTGLAEECKAALCLEEFLTVHGGAAPGLLNWWFPSGSVGWSGGSGGRGGDAHAAPGARVVGTPAVAVPTPQPEILRRIRTGPSP